VAQARPATREPLPLYERDFCLWIEQHAALLRAGRFAGLDLENLIEEIEAIAAATGRRSRAISSSC
jgi:uncharacterized protein DUF29